MRVLVVDDEASVCSAIADFLREEGFDVTEAYTPGNALAIAKEEGPNLSAIVTDVNMPEMDGLQMWEQMRPVVSSNCKAIFISGLAKKYLLDGWVFPGELLQKPFSYRLLLEKLLH